MLNGLQPWHLIILVIVVVLLFGAKRLPDAARSIGKSMKIFRAETKDMKDKDEEASAEHTENAENRALPAAKTQNSEPQVAELQRQLDELKKQQSTTSEQAQKNAT